MARMGMKIHIFKSDMESKTVVSLCKMSEKAYAEINPEVLTVFPQGYTVTSFV